MALLAGKLYDPSTAVSWGAATSALAAFDTTNLRLSFTVPPNGSVLVRMAGVVAGATTYSQFLLGVLEGATVRGRVTPTASLGGTALATTTMKIEAVFVVTGLTAGAALTWDAAWAMEAAATSSQIKYGGANSTSPQAWGGFSYEIWSTN